MFKAGDVVFGKFPTIDKNGQVVVLRHHSVVLMANEEGALLVYTTSMKDDLVRFNPATRFTNEDMRLAGWTKACLWDASTVAVVPNSDLVRRGRISSDTLKKIQQGYLRAQQTRSLSMVMLNTKGETVTA